MSLSKLDILVATLRESGSLTPETEEIIAKHIDPYAIAYALASLKKAGILTLEYRDLVASHTYPLVLASMLCSLPEAIILSPEKRALIVAKAYRDSADSWFCALEEGGILTAPNCDAVAAHPNPRGLAAILCYLQEAGILTQENLHALRAPNHAALISEDALSHVWSKIPLNGIYQRMYDALLSAAEHPRPMDELMRVSALMIRPFSTPALSGAGMYKLSLDEQTSGRMRPAM